MGEGEGQTSQGGLDSGLDRYVGIEYQADGAVGPVDCLQLGKDGVGAAAPVPEAVDPAEADGVETVGAGGVGLSLAFGEVHVAATLGFTGLGRQQGGKVGAAACVGGGEVLRVLPVGEAAPDERGTAGPVHQQQAVPVEGWEADQPAGACDAEGLLYLVGRGVAVVVGGDQLAGCRLGEARRQQISQGGPGHHSSPPDTPEGLAQSCFFLPDPPPSRARGGGVFSWLMVLSPGRGQ